MNKEKSKDKEQYSVNEMVKVMNEISILLSPWTSWGDHGVAERLCTGKSIEDCQRDAIVELHYYRKYRR